MITKIQKWGNSQGVRFPKDVLRKAHVSIGDDVDISIENGRIVVKPTTVNRGKYKLKNLLSKMPENYRPNEIDWGKPMGGEVW
jgi:antitoxin MazE